MGPWTSLKTVLRAAPDPAKAVGAGAQSLNAGVKSAEAAAQTLKKTGDGLSPYLPWLWALLGVVLAAAAVVGVVLLVRWWRRRRPVAHAAGGVAPLSRGRLLQVRQAFLSGLPLANRAAVVDLPTVVVLGPAGSGKTQLIGLDVDWQRQARQFLPSYTSDPLLQIYLGPDCTVHEVSAPLLEDDSLQARAALRRMWRRCFNRRNRGLAALVLDVRWLIDTPPDEQRRMAQLLRGKLNLVSEAGGAPVETRLCLTNMDGIEGFEDFARLLKGHGVPLSFDLPRQGEEGLVSLIAGQEQYLALGLKSLPVDAFERLERFYSQAGRSFAGLGRFIACLLEGDTLSFKPRLTRVFLSSPTPEARASGALSVGTEASNPQALRRQYEQTHLRRAALIAAVGCLPVLAAYLNYFVLLGRAQDQVAKFEGTVATLREQGLEGRGEVVEKQVNEAADAIGHLWRAARWWPPLQSSFPKEMKALRAKLAHGIRESHLKPALLRCHEHPGACRPEQVVYLLAALHASNKEPLGEFVRSSVQPQNSRSWRDDQSDDAGPAAASGAEKARTWISALDLRESLVATYVLSSDEPWARDPPCRRGEQVVAGSPEEEWSCWPFRSRLTEEAQLKPWLDHLTLLRQTLEAGPKGLPDLELLREEKDKLKAQLADLDAFSSLPTVLNVIDASKVQVNRHYFPGIETTVEALGWLKDNRDTLAAVLRMEEEASAGYQTVEKMTPSELLTRDGLWLTGNEKGPYRIELLQQSFEFRPPQLSRNLLQALLDAYEKGGRLNMGPRADAGQGLGGLTRASFDTDLKPLVDDFTQRLKNAQLPLEEAATREEYIQKRVNFFAVRYRQAILDILARYRFSAPRAVLLDELSRLSLPSSAQVDMLRDVATKANLDPLEGPYYESLRNAVAPFRPIVQLMTADKNGAYVALAPYQALLARMHDELDAASGDKAAGGKDKDGKDKGGKNAGGKDKGGKDKADKDADKLAGDDGADADKDAAATADLSDLLTPLEKVALSMLLEEDSSYLRKAQEWLDQQGITGELRQPFLEPFLHVQELGKKDLEATLKRQWDESSGRMLRPMFARYPFNAESKEDVDPGELEVLRRKDGAFWRFVNQVFSRVCVERGSQWALRGPLREKLTLPDAVLPTLSRLSRLSKLLWDEDGKPRPLMLKVQPQPLPPSPLPGVFVTMSSLKCGKTTAYGFNQTPTWQDFPLSWWDQQVASIVLELRSPTRDTPQFLSLPWSRSAWSCFRLFEEATLTPDQHRLWSLSLQGGGGDKRALDIKYGVKGEPWAPFREVPR